MPCETLSCDHFHLMGGSCFNMVSLSEDCLSSLAHLPFLFPFTANTRFRGEYEDYIESIDAEDCNYENKS